MPEQHELSGSGQIAPARERFWFTDDVTRRYVEGLESALERLLANPGSPDAQAAARAALEGEAAPPDRDLIEGLTNIARSLRAEGCDGDADLLDEARDALQPKRTLRCVCGATDPADCQPVCGRLPVHERFTYQ